jgi:predicted glycosyltransferase
MDSSLLTQLRHDGHAAVGEQLPKAALDATAGAEPAARGARVRQIGRRRSAGSARPLRALLYSHDTFGLGHLRRNIAIAEHLLQRDPRFEVRLLSGSPVVTSWPLPERLELSVMPPVVKVGAEQYVARNGAVSLAEIRRQREAVIVRTIRDFQPDVFLVDHAPVGMKGELLTPLSLLRADFPGTKSILGLRDILDEGPTVRALWHDQGTYEVIRWAYDRIFVYGSQWLFDVCKEYGLPADVSAKLFYCGHVARATGSHAQPRVSHRGDGKTVLVTVGGGGDGFPLVDAYLRALDCLAVSPAHSIIVSGPLMPAEQHLNLETRAATHPSVQVLRSTTEMSSLIAQADVVVTMAGYNSSVEILAARKPAILFPRPAPRAEQRIRAEMFANMGLAWAVPPDDNAAGTLARCLDQALSGARPARLDDSLVDLEGARRVGDIIDAQLRVETHAGADPSRISL